MGSTALNLSALRRQQFLVGAPTVPLAGPFPSPHWQLVQGPHFVGFQIAGKVVWLIDDRWFGGNPSLTAQSVANRLTVTLANARYPGTNLPADFVVVLTPSLGLTGTIMHLTMTLGGFTSQGSFEEWLTGHAAAASPVTFNMDACDLNAQSKVTLAGTASAQFLPSWVLRLQGSKIASISGFGQAMQSDSCTLSLLDPMAPSLKATPAQKRTMLAFQRGTYTWTLTPSITATPIGSLTVPPNPFDVLQVEAGETQTAPPPRTLLAAPASGAALFGFQVAGNLTDADGHPLQLGLRLVEYAIDFDPSGDQTALMAHFAADPAWLLVQGFALQVGDTAGNVPFEILGTGGKLTSVGCAPALLQVAVPLAGGVGEPAQLPPSTVAFVSPTNIPPLKTTPNWVVAGAVAQGPSVALSSFGVSVLRRDDLLSLGFQFFNFTLEAGGGQAPRLIQTDPAQSSYIAATIGPQNIAEQAFFEVASGYNLAMPNRPPDPDQNTGVELPENGPFPVLSRMAGDSRLAFQFAPNAQPIPFTLESLLSWTNYPQSVVPAALPPVTTPPPPPIPLRPPQANETAIESPYRLVLSTNLNAAWNNATSPVTASGWTELWHTRLEGSDTVRALRAVWSPDYRPANPPAHYFPPPHPPDPDNPFRWSLDARDRYEIVGLSADFNMTIASGPAPMPYLPQPIEAERLMLSSLGAWMNVRGAWNPPAAATEKNLPVQSFSVEEWRHRATMARDNYVRVVYAGYLIPFCNRASLVKITERKFYTNPNLPARVAYLRQRMYIVVREPVKDFPATVRSKFQFQGRELPFDQVQITTLVTPDLDQPTVDAVGAEGQLAFWPNVGGSPFLFHLVARDLDGQLSEFTAPLIFVDRSAAFDPTVMAAVQTNYLAKTDRRQRALNGQKVAFAPHKVLGDTTFEAASITFGAGLFAGDPTADLPGFYPLVEQADVHLPAVRQFANPAGGGQPAPVTISYLQDYLQKDFNPQGEVFAQLAGTLPIGFSGDKSIGVTAPNLNIAGLSRRYGTVGGDPNDIAGSLKDFTGGTFNPSKFFDTSATILGGITLADIINTITGGGFGDGTAPKLTTDTSDPTQIKVVLNWTPDVKANSILVFNKSTSTPPLSIVAATTTFLNGQPGQQSLNGTLTDFVIDFLGIIKLNFASLEFKPEKGKKLDVNANMQNPPVLFDGALSFVNQLEQIIPPDGFIDPPSLDVTAEGVTASYTLKVPSVGVGVFSLENISFSAGLTLPFTSQPARVRFGFAERHNTFLLTVWLLGGGGFLGIALGVDGIELVEAALEFGANISLDLGVASGHVYILAGIYFKLEKETSPPPDEDVQITGYVRAGGSLNVLGLITISVEFYLGLTYDSALNEVWGEASVTVEVDVACFSKSVSLSVRKEFQVPKSRAALPQAARPLPAAAAVTDQEWKEYAAAFA